MASMTTNELKGIVAKSSNGDIGVIVRKIDDKYVGYSLKTTAWYSRKPTIVAHSLQEYIDNLIEEQISNETRSYISLLQKLSRHDTLNSEIDFVKLCIDEIKKRAKLRRDMRHAIEYVDEYTDETEEV